MRNVEEYFVAGKSNRDLQISPDHFLMVFKAVDSKVGQCGCVVYEVRSNKFVNRFFTTTKEPLEAALDYKRSIF